jgi:2-polyprenyl-6-methoxyphenol hydroxylase-like FAD-dependent oxidoreductase
MELMPDHEVPILIAGGSLVGMSAAMLLAHHGVPSLTVEHHRGTAIHPRAALISQRTMEVLRTVGLEGIVREQSETLTRSRRTHHYARACRLTNARLEVGSRQLPRRFIRHISSLLSQGLPPFRYSVVNP